MALGEWTATGWWRVIAPDGSLWCETSDEQEARKSMRPGDALEQNEEIKFSRWQNRYVKPGDALQRIASSPNAGMTSPHKFDCPARQRDVVCMCGADK